MSDDGKTDLVEAARTALRRLTTEIDGLDARAAEYFGLNRTDQHCIDVVVGRGPVTPSELARATSLSSGGATIALDRLEQAGMVRRRSNPADRRSVLIEATERARRTGREFFGPLSRAERQLLSRYSPSQLHAIAEFLDGLASVLSKHQVDARQDVGDDREPHHQ